MAKSYRVSAGTRLVNAWFRLLTRVGLGRDERHVLGVRGRKTGRTYEVPVDVMTVEGERWLVAPYGEVAWVKNARAAGEVTLSRGGRTETAAVTEVDPTEAVPALRRYVETVPVTRAYFDVEPEDGDDAFVAAAAEHPVFRISAPRE